MSVLIKGMEMPTSCDDCPLQHSEYLECKITGNNTWEWADDHTTRTIHPKPSDCPLVPVPPHGRLIDADAFEKVNAYFWGMDFINAKYEDCLCDLINAAPTIIPASEEGEG